jgi:hypothetical protein
MAMGAAPVDENAAAVSGGDGWIAGTPDDENGPKITAYCLLPTAHCPLPTTQIDEYSG